jgi:hypothetical protein
LISLTLVQCAIRSISLVFQDHVSKDVGPQNRKCVTHSQERPRAHRGSFDFQMYLCSYWNLDVRLVLFIFSSALNYLKNNVTHVFITADWFCSAVPLIRFLGLFSQLIFESFGESSYFNASITDENRNWNSRTRILLQVCCSRFCSTLHLALCYWR